MSDENRSALYKQAWFQFYHRSKLGCDFSTPLTEMSCFSLIFFCVTELDWPKSLMQQKKIAWFWLFPNWWSKPDKCAKKCIYRQGRFENCQLLPCWLWHLAFCHCWVSGNLLCVTVHLCKCVGTYVCVSMFECNCVLWSDRLQFRTRAAVKLFHWNDPTGSQPHGRSHIQRFYTIRLAHSPLAWFNRSPNDWTETFAHRFPHSFLDS